MQRQRSTKHSAAGADRSGGVINWNSGIHWGLLSALVWTLLSGASGWYLGLPVMLAATATALWLRLPAPDPRVLLRLPRFFAFYLRTLWQGGWDVARRALSPSLPIDPAWTTYELQRRYRDDPLYPRLRLLMSALIGLLPGTLSARYQAHELQVHVLDQQQDWVSTARRLEDELARLLGVKPS